MINRRVEGLPVKIGRQLMLSKKNTITGAPSHEAGGNNHLQLVDSEGVRHDTYVDVVGRERGLLIILGWGSVAQIG